MRRDGGACLLRRFARPCTCPHKRSEEVSLGDQHQNSQSRSRDQNLPEAAAPRPKLSGSALIVYSFYRQVAARPQRSRIQIIVANLGRKKTCARNQMFKKMLPVNTSWAENFLYVEGKSSAMNKKILVRFGDLHGLEIRRRARDCPFHCFFCG